MASNPNGGWRRAITKVQAVNANQRKTTRPEWRDFPDHMIAVLQSFEEDDCARSGAFGSVDAPDGMASGSASIAGTPSSPASTSDLKALFRANQDFVKQVLLVCLETRRGRLSFYIDQVDEVILAEEYHVDVAGFWRDVFYLLFDKAVEMNDRAALREALTAAHDRPPAKIKRPGRNCPALVTATFKDNLRMVRLFVGKGYRMRSVHFGKPRDLGVWDHMPFKIKTKAQMEEDIGETDEVQQIHILRAMARPCYILARYSVVYESRRFNSSAADTCCSVGKCTNPPVSAPSFKTYMGSIVEDDDDTGGGAFHPCPNSDKFTPAAGCSLHPECNDPIFRCFELAQIAAHHARLVPEYREQYLEIVSGCSELAVDLLGLCRDTREVELLLAEKTGSRVFFRKDVAKKMVYPRLQMAIANNHRSFVGHMFCQQILRSQWNGSVSWHGRTKKFRALYSTVQMGLTLLFVAHYLARQTIRDFGITREHFHKVKLSSRTYDLLTGPCNLDEPLNRFLSYTGMYIWFFLLVMSCVLSPMSDVDQAANNFHWYHQLLLVFTMAMVVHDLSVLTSVRSMAISFWRIYDMIMHAFLMSAFFARLLMGQIHPCQYPDICGDQPDQADHCCPQDQIDKRQPFDSVSICLFAMAAVMASVRMLYWFQLHTTIGPIVINLSRVFMDIMTFALIYGILILGFSMGLVPLAFLNAGYGSNASGGTTDTFQNNGQNNGTTTPAAMYWDDMFNVLFWSILNPQEPANFDNSRLDGFFAILMVAIYSVLSVVVLLNVLVACMNYTMQRMKDQQLLYWKFVRTSIWIEFFGENSALPQPFSLITVIRAVVKGIYRRLSKRCSKSRKISVSITSPPVIPKETLEVRRRHQREHGQLMMALIQRYWDAHQVKEASSAASVVPASTATTSAMTTSTSSGQIRPPGLLSMTLPQSRSANDLNLATMPNGLTPKAARITKKDRLRKDASIDVTVLDIAESGC